MVRTRSTQTRSEASREKVLAAAERLMRSDPARSFSMRDLAAEADVSFATPFNLFGGKARIAQALSTRRIEEMAERVSAARLEGDCVDRVLQASAIAIQLLLEEPTLNRAMLAALGAWADEPGEVRVRSRALWALALGDLDGIDPRLRAVASAKLADHIAIVFRGCLSFWVAAEISDEALPHEGATAVATAVAAFAPKERRASLLGMKWD
ncbi:TetR/AcrR family transcriptional regulator [Hansschlegelia zhihuaiae]|uniref:TetR/AcrR family transcriptional regulator n=2 Tax=Hansschlegelia zhihuaiae TaxID=405005 RepID=A0A4V1KHP7_9HYPH|nr:TetR family transcriptional regulator [Hansschlegelia zhihuaiae]RXF67932.1 TetR/AcrR family transcriptional regulator [Hansschlegelia zhihuaiae]